MTPEYLRQFLIGLVCLRCHDVIAPGSPLDDELCPACWDELRQDDCGLSAAAMAAEELDARRQMVEAAATHAAMSGAGRDYSFDDAECPW